MKRKLLFAFIIMALTQQPIWAGGFKIGLQGTKQIGIGHTGVGFAQDAATLYFNPAGMCFVDNQLNLAYNLLAPSISFLEGYTNNLTNATGNVYVPFSLYGKCNLTKNKNLSFGMGVYTPFGSGVHYPYEWTGRFVLTDVSLTSIYFQPTLSLKLSPKLSIGGGYVLAAGQFTLEKDLPLQSLTTGEYAHAKLKGNAGGNGYNLGIYYNSGKKVNIGLTYHSKVSMAVDKGDATFTGIPAAAASSFPSDNTFSTHLTLPGELGLGLSYKVNKNITAAVDMNYTYWQTYDYLSFDYAKNTSALKDSKSPRLYENSFAIRGGVQAYFPKNVVARVGAFYDQTPVQDGYVAPELPDNNKVGLTCGVTYSVRQYFMIDLGLLYEDVAKRTDRNIESNMYGTYKTKVICPSIGMTYVFTKTEKKTK